MYGPLPQTMQEAFEVFTAEDAPLDCHRHCLHWVSEGECCECGAKQGPTPVTYTPEGLGEEEPIYTSEIFKGANALKAPTGMENLRPTPSHKPLPRSSVYAN